MVALTRCPIGSDDESSGVDDSDSSSDSDVVDDDDDFCALNVTLCDSLNAECLWLCSCSFSLCGLVMVADGSGLVSVIRAPKTVLSFQGGKNRINFGCAMCCVQCALKTISWLAISYLSIWIEQNWHKNGNDNKSFQIVMVYLSLAS